MKSTILVRLVTIALMLGSTVASAQSSGSVAVQVPFDFMVGKTMFPAGEYTLGSVEPHTFVLAARNGYEFVVMKTSPVLMKSGAHDGLVFVNDGHHYRLHEVRMDTLKGERLAEGLPVTRQAVAAKSSRSVRERRIRLISYSRPAQ
jgi:hypothetical protein